MTNLSLARKRWMAPAISCPAAVDSAPLPSRITRPFTRLSRPAASSPNTTSITVTRLGVRMLPGAAALSSIGWRKSSASTMLPGSPSPRASENTSSRTKISTTNTTVLAKVFITAIRRERSQVRKRIMKIPSGRNSGRVGQSNEKARPPTGAGLFVLTNPFGLRSASAATATSPFLRFAQREGGVKLSLVLEHVAHRILGAAHRVLHLAGGLVGGTFGLQLGVAGDLAGRLFKGALGLVRGTFDSVLIHTQLS